MKIGNDELFNWGLAVGASVVIFLSALLICMVLVAIALKVGWLVTACIVAAIIAITPWVRRNVVK